MKEEIIKKVAVIKSGKLALILEGKGSDSYQYIYREAAEVYWDSGINCFKSTESKEWPYPTWFSHIIKIVARIGVTLILSDKVIWSGLEKADIKKMVNHYTNND